MNNTLSLIQFEESEIQTIVVDLNLPEEQVRDELMKFTASCLANYSTYEAYRQVSTLSDNCNHHVKIEAWENYVTLRNIRSKVSNLSAIKSVARADKEYLDKMGVLKQDALDLAVSLAAMADENSHVVEEETRLQHEIEKLKARRIMIRERFAERWGVLTEYSKINAKVRNENEDRWAKEFRTLKYDDAMRKGGLPGYIQLRTQEESERIRREYVRRSDVRSHILKVKSMVSEANRARGVSALEDALRDGKLSFLASNIITGDTQFIGFGTSPSEEEEANKAGLPQTP